MTLYFLLRFILRIFARVFLRLKVEGRENLPKQGGFILASNHASSLDPLLLTAAMPRCIRWLVIYEYYDLWYLKWIVRQMRFIRIKGNLSKEAFRSLLRGEVVGIFPEGRRCWDGKLGPARAGVAALARGTSCPVVPVGISGTFEALPRTRKGVRFTPVTIHIGTPLYFSDPEQRANRAKMDEDNARKIMSAIADLLEK
jgi:1-acyl-sn-glycerol-3-phosphate acyltransferase